MNTGENATAPDGVVHRIASLASGGVLCGAMKLINSRTPPEETEYWLFWVRKPLTCLACIARMEMS